MRETCGEWKGVLNLIETLGPLAVMCSIFCKDFRLDDEDSLSILRDLTLLMSPWGSEGWWDDWAGAHGIASCKWNRLTRKSMELTLCHTIS